MFKSRKKPGKPAENPLARRVVRGDDSPTEPLEDAAGGAIDPGEAATRLLDDGNGAAAALADPPVAVLLIIAGPGQGKLLTMGYGMNTLGRGHDQRIALDFGDERISRSAHASLTYDGKGRRFYLQHGGGASLTYHDDAPVLEPLEIVSGARIRVGETELLFRALVGPDFDWNTASP
jgi:hypothetical protein